MKRWLDRSACFAAGAVSALLLFRWLDPAAPDGQVGKNIGGMRDKHVVVIGHNPEQDTKWWYSTGSNEHPNAGPIGVTAVTFREGSDWMKAVQFAIRPGALVGWSPKSPRVKKQAEDE